LTFNKNSFATDKGAMTSTGGFMAKKNRKKIEIPQEETGKTLLSWKTEEFVQIERSWVWYLVGGIIALGLLILSVIYRQWLLAIIVILLSLVLVQLSKTKPAEVEVKITEKGIIDKDKFHFFTEFKSFGILESQRRLELDAKKIFAKSLSIPIGDVDIKKIKDILSQRLIEVEKKEMWIDKLSKALKI